MLRAYDHDSAQSLVPYLESITLELKERRHEIRVLESAIDRLQRTDGPSTEIGDLRAALANHRFEFRLALEELERLGCSVDEHKPFRVLIPGADGSLVGGFAYELSLADPSSLRLDSLDPSDQGAHAV